MEKDMSIRKVRDTSCSCNSCGARNYDATIPSPDVKRVDTLYEVRIGMMCNRLCKDCLNELVLNVAVVLGKEG